VRLLLIRHGATAWNTTGRFQGQADPPLSPPGVRQARALADCMASEVVHACYTSDLQRARETARTVAKPLGLQVRLDRRWREMAFGAWEGFHWDEIRQRDPEGLAAWQTDPLRVAPPGGETLAQLADRVADALACLRQHHDTQTVMLVAHGGPLRMLLCLALGLSPRLHWYFGLTPGSLSEMHVDRQGAMLTRLDDMPGAAKWSPRPAREKT
jgi:alpha-ribazole phosphatase